MPMDLYRGSAKQGGQALPKTIVEVTFAVVGLGRCDMHANLPGPDVTSVFGRGVVGKKISHFSNLVWQ